MAKRKITVTVDEELVDWLRAVDTGSVSGVVNQALVELRERRAQNEALGMMLDEWDREFGPTDGAYLADAQAAFDEAAGMLPRRTA